MNPLSDEDLVLYHYRDGLDRERIAELDRALREDAELAARYERLQAELKTAAQAFAVEEPDAGFEDRLWSKLEPKLPREPLRVRMSRWLASYSRPLIAVGATAVLVFGVLLGRATVPDPPPPPPEFAAELPPLLDQESGERVLAAYVSEHLASTERALLIAANSPDEAETARQLARALIATNRLYAIAAERAERPHLVRFLRELEPVLLMLANSYLPADTAAVRESIRRRDLPFKTRAAAAAARRDLMRSL